MNENFEKETQVDLEDAVQEKPSGEGVKTIPPTVGYVAVGIAVLLLAIFILVKVSTPTIEEQPQIVPVVNEKPLITAEEVEIERFSLSTDLPTNTKPDSNKDLSAGSDIDISELEIAREATMEEALEAANSPQVSQSPEKTVVESSKPGFGFTGEVTVVNTATEGQPIVSRNIEGTVHSINTDQSLITVNTVDGPYQVHVNDNTDFIINGKFFAFADLKVLDIVSVNGKGAAASHELMATQVEVTDILELNGSIN